jgi:3-hydroxyisobutyrate dehydrogenase-like beta-hydroxyacid dehydrogenase
MSQQVSPDQIRTVAFVGLGRMGSGIASNLLKAGFPLTVYNRTAAKMQPLLDKGAVAARSPQDAAADADVVFTCLMDDQSVLDAVGGADGILAGLKPGAIHIGTTTVSTGCAKRLAALHAAHGSHYVAAPVLGRPDVAAAGQLLTFVAGDPAVIAACSRIFAAYAQAPLNLGAEPASANSMKIAVNYVVASLIELMGEVYAYAERSGIDLQFMNMMLATMLGPPALKDYANRIRARQFEPAGFELIAGLKDIQLMLEASTETRVALPYASVIHDKLLAAIANGMAHKDWGAIYEITRMNAGLK